MKRPLLFIIFFSLVPMTSFAASGIEAITIAGDGKSYSVTLQILAVMTLLTVLPSLLVMMTSFTRIIIVFSILRQAMGTPQTPSNQILLGLALFLTFFIMSPVLEKANEEALQPYLNDQIAADIAITKAIEPFRGFMLRQTRSDDLEMFARISGAEPITDESDVPLSLLLPAFVTSELKTAFQIGFMIFVPFLIIDMIVASVLMSMGMMMLSPLIISLPFKLMLFVLVDGWSLIMETLAASFFT
ncbi:flagellar type III secretion system pore protein FliP [uncultured Cycloclasticus sp.]|uniref:flagellar type III secretion system pore protein FliP n=1 Tax=uncultured Cycloclasticus sp. TaxID=172194 RepID=UPI00258FDFF1|nr:flagellar type III secretion system pore protein FliP [uncultured Cycloclasticus sp.]